MEDSRDVYVLIFMSKTWKELIGVYSTEEKAKDVYYAFVSKMGGASSFDGFSILRRKIDEIYNPNQPED